MLGVKKGKGLAVSMRLPDRASAALLTTKRNANTWREIPRLVLYSHWSAEL